MPDRSEHQHEAHHTHDSHQEKELRDQLGEILEQLPREVRIALFTAPGKNEGYNDAARKALRLFAKLSPKIALEEFPLDHDLAEKWNVDFSPTFLINPEQYGFRWMGAPIGEEGRTFVEALLLLGMGKSKLSEQSMKVIEKLDTPRNVKVFISPTCPYCPQQAVNAIKAVVEKPELVSLELVDVQAHPDLADEYDAQSVPQTHSDGVLIAQGAQPEELFISSLTSLEEKTFFIPESDADLVETDLVIVGGGPAGLTAAIYAVRAGLNAVLLERGLLGGQVATTPVVENYLGFNQVGGKALVDFMVSHALEYVQIFQGEEVMEIRPGHPMEVLSNRRRFLTKMVLLATGAHHRRLGAKGENRLSGRGVSYCSTCDGPLFKGKRVVIVGGGNSAATEALHLKNIGVDVTLVHRRDRLRAQEHLTANLTGNDIPILYNTEIREIRGKNRVTEVELFNNATQEVSVKEVDGVFVAIGYEPENALAKKLGLELTSEGYIQRDAKHRTSLPGIYTAGDVEGGYKQIVTAAGQGAEAAMSIFEDLIQPYWEREAPADTE